MPRSQDITKHRHGWLRPDGKFFGCSREGHLSLLDDLGIHFIDAEKLGWIKIGTSLGGDVVMYPGDILGGKVSVTQGQLNALDRFCSASGIELPWWATKECV